MDNYSLYLQSLKTLISFKSVKGEAFKNAPFGIENNLALNYVLNLAESFGFKTINYDGFAGEVIFGEGEEFGIIGHLDVVPVNKGWNTDPFCLTLKNGVYYARGVADDKGPILACLFALKELKDQGCFPKKKFRLIFGLNEESGWKDVEYLKTKTTLPEIGFSPDGNFPVIYAEKGPCKIDFYLPKPENVIDVSTGLNVVNAVPDYAFLNGKVDHMLAEKFNLSVNGHFIESFGIASHGSKPELGKNAIKPILEYLNEQNHGIFDNALNYLFYDKLQICKIGNETGYATLSPNVIKVENNKIVLSVDFRVPAKYDIEFFIPKFNSFNLEYEITSYRKPHYVDPNDPFVKTLVSCYNSVTGESLKPATCSGATFASVFKKGVAFGGEFPWANTKIHEANENITEKDLMLLYNVYKKTIYELAK